MASTSFSVRILDSLVAVDAAQWDRLAGGHPFLSHAFLHALHETGCASEKTGWLPQFVTLWNEGTPASQGTPGTAATLAGALPLYLKSHSYGEYVFDWAWADAYNRHGLDYYPKLLSAIPFSPVSGPRLLAPDAATRRALIEAALAHAHRLSSLHCLFPPENEALEWQAAGLMLRQGVQFHWENRGYADFEAFLAQLSHDKRKKIRQERRRVREAGIVLRRLCGAAITREHWRFFTHCYNLTYRAHHSTPYLNLAFFERLGETMPDHVLLILAERDGVPLASTLNLFTEEALYGRYWGAIE